MAEISYQNLKAYLKERDSQGGEGVGPVCLIHGEDLLLRTALMRSSSTSSPRPATV